MATRPLTRHSHIHPYPAMIADQLALELAEELVGPDTRVFDPFCGTGRTLLAAAERGGYCVGVDINPLAILIAESKMTDFLASRIEDVLATSISARSKGVPALELEPMRKVRWFPERARIELSQIISWLNSQSLPRRLLTLLSVILSATAREVSFCRKDQWKLHRMPASKRRSHDPSAWKAFERRVRQFSSDLQKLPPLIGEARFYLGDAKRVNRIRRLAHLPKFDLVLTSPPYGDSRTTVSYGGVSSLCLGVLQHVGGIPAPFVSQSVLDGRCLGGTTGKKSGFESAMSAYWHGGKQNPAQTRVRSFLADLEACCSQIACVLSHEGRAVFVVSRRSVGGRRLYMDLFLCEKMREYGFELEWSRERKLACKNTPLIVDSCGAGAECVRTRTMRDEVILSFARCPRQVLRTGSTKSLVQNTEEKAPRQSAGPGGTG
jgi:tRNA G10  N-methylase Trm11